MTRIGELLLQEIGELHGTHKVVSWTTGSARGEFKMAADKLVSIARADAVAHLAEVCRLGGGVLVYATSDRKARDGSPILNVSGYAGSQNLFTRMAREDVEWSLTHDPKTFEPLPTGHSVRFVD